MKKVLKIYEAYRHSDLFNRDDILLVVKAPNADSAHKYCADKFKKLYGDEKPFRVRLKE